MIQVGRRDAFRHRNGCPSRDANTIGVPSAWTRSADLNSSRTALSLAHIESTCPLADVICGGGPPARRRDIARLIMSSAERARSIAAIGTPPSQVTGNASGDPQGPAPPASHSGEDEHSLLCPGVVDAYTAQGLQLTDHAPVSLCDTA